MIKGRDKPLYSFWGNSSGRNKYSETMTRNKFQLVLRYIRFDEKATRTQRGGTDKFATIRELWESVIMNCQKAFFPHANVTIDEQLFPCRSRCPFIQHMPQKPAKFGINFGRFVTQTPAIFFKLFLILDKQIELKKVLKTTLWSNWWTLVSTRD